MPSNRITYIDALRGFTMILVVMNHITTKCFGIDLWSQNVDNVYSYTIFLQEFRMPLFFFISGFVLFKPSDIWGGKHIVSFFKKKIPVQLLSPLVFFLAYLFVEDISIHDGFFSPTKKGYWFTFTLLEFYFFYAIIRFACLKLKLNGKFTDILLLMCGLAFIGSRLVLKGHPIHDFLGMGKWYLFLYLVLGTLVRKHFKTFERLLDNGVIIIVSVILFFGLNIFYRYLPDHFTFLPILPLAGIVIVFAFFRKHGSQPPINTSTDKMERLSDFQQFKYSPLQFIGRRTLDIYLLHYFIIPTRLSECFTVFRDHAIPVVELACSLIVTFVVIFVCLIISEVIRLNPHMAHWAFGAKIEQPDNVKKPNEKME